MSHQSIGELRASFRGDEAPDRWRVIHEWMTVPRTRAARVGVFVMVVLWALVLLGSVVGESDGETTWSALVVSTGLFLGIAAALAALVEQRRRLYFHPPAIASLQQSVRAERAHRIESLLEDKGIAGRLEDIQRALRWTSEATVEGLAAAVERGTVVEDFDLQTHHYVYVSTRYAPTVFDAHDDFVERLRRESAVPRPVVLHEEEEA